MWGGSCLRQVTGRKAAVDGISDSFPFPSLQPAQVLSHCGGLNCTSGTTIPTNPRLQTPAVGQVWGGEGKGKPGWGKQM